MPTSKIVVCCLAFLAAGCSSNRPPTPEQEQEGNLLQVGELVRNYQMVKGVPPAKLADLTSVRSIAGNGHEAIRSGAVVLRYGATLPDTKEDPGQSSSEEVLAYQKAVPERGGQVLLLNRSIKTMTPDEFKAAKLAGKSSPGPESASKKK